LSVVPTGQQLAVVSRLCQQLAVVSTGVSAVSCSQDGCVSG